MSQNEETTFQVEVALDDLIEWGIEELNDFVEETYCNRVDRTVAVTDIGYAPVAVTPARDGADALVVIAVTATIEDIYYD